MKENPLAKRLHPIYKDVVIVGNGPSGLSMSYVLAGRALTYNGRSHPDAILDAALRSTLQKDAVITESDLSSLAQCVESRGGSTPLGHLLDHLVRPGADAGLRLPPVVDWSDHPTRSLSHVVIGKGPPGGTWKKMDGRTMTLSLSSWMELPGLPLHESEVGKKERVTAEGVRVATSTIADYYQEYVHKMGLQKYQRRGIVTSVAEYDDADDVENDKKINWVIEGRDLHGRKFRYLSKYVVLACGTNDSPNRLGVPGERLPWVHHSTKDLDEFLRRQNPSKEDGPVLVVGSGLSAGDGVLCVRSHGATAFHIYRGKQGLSRWLPLTAYPEYLSVHELMTGAATCPTYRGTGSLRLARCHNGANGRRLVTLESSEGNSEVLEVSAVAILVGSAADLSFLPRDDLGLQKGAVDPRSNPLDISLTTHQLNRLANCYGVGPLAGDMFVRHILGGVVAAATHIQKTIRGIN
uniref:Oxidative stress-induced growth inhibitor 2 n=2 Tax=Lygus hesperus TaxID=30085 RepID=A0A146LQ60_LYGHE